mgnify:CR=1 FL=1
MPGSHTVYVSTPRPIILTAALAVAPDRIRHIPQFLCFGYPLSLENLNRGVARSTLGVEVGPQVSVYQFSVFSC